ncbi:MAG TPA: SDR family NAD(P)-dependent oxidoreductase [Candidatus Binatia bacterium]|nr:SDR family NAD(P)-dependent oxidoreductase [Candidatus Binatia bacterium]
MEDPLSKYLNHHKRRGRLYFGPSQGICYAQSMSARFDKIVLVTGGSSGIGAAIASEFARRGCRVAITARDLTKLGTAADKMVQNGVQVRAIACDVTRREQVRRLRDSIREFWGDVQILVNNAGIARAVSFADMTDETWDQTLDTNLTGAYNCCKAFLPAMVKVKWGRILNIASTTAKVGYSHVTAYTASKHGLLGLTRSLALETARQGVTVHAICPGYVDDERTRENARVMAEKTGKSVDDILRLFAASAPQNRLIAAGEVADLACLIASPEMSGMTGQAINVDGGAVMV